jgi:hypothetical protein
MKRGRRRASALRKIPRVVCAACGKSGRPSSSAVTLVEPKSQRRHVGFSNAFFVASLLCNGDLGRRHALVQSLPEEQPGAMRARVFTIAMLSPAGSFVAIARTITEGVPHPKQHTGVMPPMGGAQLSPSDVRALAAYIAALNQRGER